MIDLGKRSVLGIQIDAVDYEAAVHRVVQAAKVNGPMAVTALAVHGVMTGVKDKNHNYRLNSFDLVCPDGQPVRWALNWLYGCGLPERVYGPELTLRLCEAAAHEGLPVFLFGATDDMLDLFAKNLCERFPKLQIAGKRSSKFRTLSKDECDELANEINSSGAKICFVGLGCPRQEVFAYEMRERLRMPSIAVGAAFAFHAGVLEQAPSWMQKRGLEWLFRLTREPGRLWKRYLTTNPAFLWRLLFQKLGLFAARTDKGVKPQNEVMFG